MNKNLILIVNQMEKAMKHDTCIEIYQFNNNCCVLNCYHLSSVYSTQYTLHYDSNYFYHSESYDITKFRTDLCKTILSNIKNYIKEGGEWNNIELIMSYYKKISSEVFKIKYSRGHYGYLEKMLNK